MRKLTKGREVASVDVFAQVSRQYRAQDWPIPPPLVRQLVTTFAAARDVPAYVAKVAKELLDEMGAERAVEALAARAMEPPGVRLKRDEMARAGGYRDYESYRAALEGRR